MSTLALDIGGANIKAAHSDGRAWSVPFALWKQAPQLTDCFRTQFGATPIADTLLATMTGELCDCFNTRPEGVAHILESLTNWAGDVPVRVWSITDEEFISVAIAKKHPMAIASANWHALATYLSRAHPTRAGLMIDIGSTTTDLIWLDQGTVRATGTTDRDRLASCELVYTGVQRTPIAAIARCIQMNEQTFGIAAETFALMADVYTLLQCIPESSADTDTADGQPRTRTHCANRVVRMIGSDLGLNSEADAVALAESFAALQCDHIIEAARRVVAMHTGADRDPPCDHFFLSGSGEFLAERVARCLHPQATTTKLSDMASPQASIAACAYALLQLNRDAQRHA